jgi:hypothetical protein
VERFANGSIANLYTSHNPYEAEPEGEDLMHFETFQPCPCKLKASRIERESVESIVTI